MDSKKLNLQIESISGNIKVLYDAMKSEYVDVCGEEYSEEVYGTVKDTILNQLNEIKESGSQSKYLLFIGEKDVMRSNDVIEDFESFEVLDNVDHNDEHKYDIRFMFTESRAKGLAESGLYTYKKID